MSKFSPLATLKSFHWLHLYRLAALWRGAMKLWCVIFLHWSLLVLGVKGIPDLPAEENGVLHMIVSYLCFPWFWMARHFGRELLRRRLDLKRPYQHQATSNRHVSSSSLGAKERSVALQCFTWIFERAYRQMQLRTLGPAKPIAALGFGSKERHLKCQWRAKGIGSFLPFSIFMYVGMVDTW